MKHKVAGSKESLTAPFVYDVIFRWRRCQLYDNGTFMVENTMCSIWKILCRSPRLIAQMRTSPLCV